MCKRYKNYNPAFDDPLNSQHVFDIVSLRRLSETVESVPFTQYQCKVFLVNIKDKLFSVPLLHTYIQ